MASQTFSFTEGEGGESDPVVVGAGESVRVRLTSRSLNMGLYLKISGNAVDSLVEIKDPEAWVTGAVIEGDEVSVVAKLHGDDGYCTGIIETFA